MTRRLWPALAVLLAAGAAGAVEVDPLYSARLLGGQYFLAGDESSLNGNLSALAAPALVFNERWTVLPSLSSSYQGTKGVADLVGPGTLFQEQMDHRLGVKLLHIPEGSRWRFKGSAGYKLELLRETRDERWFRGLFDYQSLLLGVESEYVRDERSSARASYDYAYTFFPNYSTLESEAAVDFQGQPLARELVGDQVLDSHRHAWGLSAGSGLGARLSGEARLSFQMQSFPKQRIVDSSGLLLSDTRHDYLTVVELEARLPVEPHPEWRMRAALKAGAASAVSNQNGYDAWRSEFTPGFYNYTEFRLGPELRSSFGDGRQPVIWTLSLAGSRRSYPHRRAADASGTYGPAGVTMDRWDLATTLAYPISPGFSLLCNLQHRRARSNHKFEQFYRGNYSATEYLFGFSYDY
ncbi:MAG: hypothetical protein A2X36_13345 [Elusimicrobia bacterium GWA2_69_24]|nr:MAG: hypothetical protein A2X36_13345 [Elusimicrobia bacterium GWA2_69_24]HBL15753.1 hypothetical protein [Elusimicrobiota bacterium]